MAEALGPDHLTDAVGVCAAFQMMTRIADGTGTPLDEGSETMSEELRQDLGIEHLESRRLMGDTTN